jgi:glycerol-3-phosphate acyltransferase PlsY
MIPLIAALGGYLLGSIPFGLLLTRAAGLGDIRHIGSGNIGATNVLRTGNKKLAGATLVLDGAKGAAALLIAQSLAGPDIGLLAGYAALLGHLFPVWLGLSGGKGVATGLGLLLAAAWPIGVVACLVWLAAARLFRFSSAGALLAFALSPLVALALAPWPVAVFALAIALPVFLRHRGNIARLRAGTEPRIGKCA